MTPEDYRQQIAFAIFDAMDSVAAAVDSVVGVNPLCKGKDNWRRFGAPTSLKSVLLFKDGIGLKVTIEVDHKPEV